MSYCVTRQEELFLSTSSARALNLATFITFFARVAGYYLWEGVKRRRNLYEGISGCVK